MVRDFDPARSPVAGVWLVNGAAVPGSDTSGGRGAASAVVLDAGGAAGYYRGGPAGRN